jgi:hypothetical protein
MVTSSAAMFPTPGGRRGHFAYRYHAANHASSTHAWRLTEAWGRAILGALGQGAGSSRFAASRCEMGGRGSAMLGWALIGSWHTARFSLLPPRAGSRRGAEPPGVPQARTPRLLAIAPRVTQRSMLAMPMRAPARATMTALDHTEPASYPIRPRGAGTIRFLARRRGMARSRGEPSDPC